MLDVLSEWENSFSWYGGMLNKYKSMVTHYQNKDPLSSGLIHDILILKYVQENTFGWRKNYFVKGRPELKDFYESVIIKTTLSRPRICVNGQNKRNGKRHEYDLVAVRENGDEKFLVVMEFKKRSSKKKKARLQIEKRKIKETYKEFLTSKIKGVFFLVCYTSISRPENLVQPSEDFIFIEEVTDYRSLKNI